MIHSATVAGSHPVCTFQIFLKFFMTSFDELVITIWDVAIPVTACENLMRDIQKTDVKSKEQFFVAGL